MEKKILLKKLPNQNHQFLEGDYPYTINPGGPNHEELVSLIGIYDYLMNLYKHHFGDEEKSILLKINKINELISKHEAEIANPILKLISEKKNFRLIGKKEIKRKNRAPTIAFTVNNITSKKISEMLVSKKIATRNDNFYAWRCLKALGINTDDGVIRISLAHYNNIEETNKLLEILNNI